MPYDLLAVIPPHQGSDLIDQAGLGDGLGFEIADKHTLDELEEPAPAFVPPGEEPKTPYASFPFPRRGPKMRLSEQQAPTMTTPQSMRINDPDAYIQADEAEIIERLLPLEGRRVLELGCGAAWMTRLLAERFSPAHIVATEVDLIQHKKNLASGGLSGVSFRYGGAETIDDPDGTYDAVFMFKSLHHVPRDLMARSLREIHRVLLPGGRAYFSEPVYWGPFNDLLRLIHDEREVREAAFGALTDAVESGLFTLEAEVFFQVPGTYETWELFEDRFLKVTHTDLAIDQERYDTIRLAFLSHMTPTGAHFLKPHRVDLLRKVA